MSAEERWAQRREWENARGEIEIKNERHLLTANSCMVNKCCDPAIAEFEVGTVDNSSGMFIFLCIDHAYDDVAFEVYRTMKAEGK